MGTIGGARDSDNLCDFSWIPQADLDARRVRPGSYFDFAISYPDGMRDGYQYRRLFYAPDTNPAATVGMYIDDCTWGTYGADLIDRDYRCTHEYTRSDGKYWLLSLSDCPAGPEGETDLPANTTTAGVAVVGGTVTGSVDSASDVDWFAVTLSADTTYFIEVLGTRSGAGTLEHPSLQGIYDGTGAALAPADGGPFTLSRVYYSPSADGTYYLAAAGRDGSTGTYTLKLTAQPDLPADTTTTGNVTLNSASLSFIETPDDKDWFAVTLEAGTAYLIDVRGTDPDGYGETADTKLVSIRSSAGAVIANTEAGGGGVGTDARFHFVPTTTGTHYIEVGAENGTAGSYRLSVDTDDFAADGATSGVMALHNGSGTATGAIETANDDDWFRVTLEGGTSYWIEVEGAATDAGTLEETALSIVTPGLASLAGIVRHVGSDIGGNLRIHFTANTDGDHYLSITSAQSDGTGTYTLTVREQKEHSDVPADDTTTAEIPVGGLFHGEVEEEGDSDWIRSSWWRTPPIPWRWKAGRSWGAGTHWPNPG